MQGRSETLHHCSPMHYTKVKSGNRIGRGIVAEAQRQAVERCAVCIRALSYRNVSPNASERESNTAGHIINFSRCRTTVLKGYHK
ncbi:hypothetical protein TNCV_4458321 [Trichonephila clavipes]|nr:hypothetical protein TNCV_4458321 [Trichonephila clavipes]